MLTFNLKTTFFTVKTSNEVYCCRIFCQLQSKRPYNKKNITRQLKDMDFMFSWQEQYLTRSLRSLVGYCSYHSNIKSISSRNRVISSMYIHMYGIICDFFRPSIFYPHPRHFTLTLDFLPSPSTFYPHPRHFTLTLDFLPSPSTFYPHPQHFTLTLDFLPSPSTFYPHPRHFTLTLDFFLPSPSTFYPHPRLFTLTLDILPSPRHCTLDPRQLDKLLIPHVYLHPSKCGHSEV